jgi:GH15 family glucan-1,4-alpha-glucosidase
MDDHRKKTAGKGTFDHEVLLDASLRVIRECALQNGAVVAANSDLSAYPSHVQDYRCVWPRDAAYMCVAANRAGLRDFQEAFFHWLCNRAEGIWESGLLFQNYQVNGPRKGLALQIDQNGSVLWAMDDFYRGDWPLPILDLAKRLADGIVSVWGKGFFTTLTQDLWEERYAYPELEQFHAYSLAACIRGLRCAVPLDPDYGRHADAMERVLKKACRRGIVRTAGLVRSVNCDASLLGLVWPFAIYEPDHPLVGRLIRQIERSLVQESGVRRYGFDEYDGHRIHGVDSRRGSGTWPILNFWLSIVLSLRGEREKAAIYPDYVFRRIRDHLIPEQLFDNEIQRSITPLGWSHAMYLLWRTEGKSR